MAPGALQGLAEGQPGTADQYGDENEAERGPADAEFGPAVSSDASSHLYRHRVPHPVRRDRIKITYICPGRPG
ncbi:hypothetical protein NKH18_43365 [Streptomyces sp. M10(2022)]